MSSALWWGCAAVVLVAAGGAGGAWWIRFTYVTVTVEGHSMAPALRPGSRVVVRRGARRVRRDRIVVVARPDRETAWRGRPPVSRDLAATAWYIKRAVAVAGDPYPPAVPGTGSVPAGHITVVGDHPWSEDSKQYGPCPLDQVLGTVVRTLG